MRKGEKSNSKGRVFYYFSKKYNSTNKIDNFVTSKKSVIMVTTLKKGATKASIKKLLDRMSKETRATGVDTLKYCGTINLKEEGLTIQKRLRDEWS